MPEDCGVLRVELGCRSRLFLKFVDLAFALQKVEF
jgi:hypothetical protein